MLIFVNISARRQQYNSFPLFSLNLHVRPGQLVAVVGHVGAGKSSLVQALLGEMDKLAGSITLRVSTAAGDWVWWENKHTVLCNVHVVVVYLFVCFCCGKEYCMSMECGQCSLAPRLVCLFFFALCYVSGT